MKMLTHLHIVVYTWWCWHIYKGGRVPRVETGVGSSDSALLRKLSVYLLLHRWETHRTWVVAAPDAGPERPVWCQSVAQVCRAHRTVAPDAGRLLFERPVVCDISECAQEVSDR